MELVFGIFTVLAGIGYVLWKAHEESPGFLTCMFVVMAAVCAPILLINVVGRADPMAGAILGIVIAAALIGYIIYLLSGGNEKMMRDTVNESTEIWAEVAKLPLPDEETLNKIKIANRIPLMPKCESYDGAALDAWRREEYNKRFMQRHKLYWTVK